MKRSGYIVLTLMTAGAIVLSSCGYDQPSKRAQYANRELCQKEWGDNCEDAGRGYWHGPHYWYSGGMTRFIPRGGTASNPSTMQGNFAPIHSSGVSSSSVHVSRGGFGGSHGSS